LKVGPLPLQKPMKAGVSKAFLFVLLLNWAVPSL